MTFKKIILTYTNSNPNLFATENFNQIINNMKFVPCKTIKKVGHLNCTFMFLIIDSSNLILNLGYLCEKGVLNYWLNLQNLHAHTIQAFSKNNKNNRHKT